MSDDSATIGDWRRMILSVVGSHPDRPLKPRALARRINIPNSDYTTFRALVRTMLDEGELVLGAGRTLRLPKHANLVVGIFRATRHGFGFLERPGHPDVYVHRRSTRGAREGDRVSARLLRGREPFPGPRAEIVRILERAPLYWIGILEQTSHGYCIHPEGRDALPTVWLDTANLGGAQPGELVVVQPFENTLESHTVRGEVVDLLGDPEDARNRVAGVIRQYGLPESFDPEVEAAAQLAADTFDPDSIDGRADFRDLLTVTIDPPDARDFDDAITVEALRGGKTRLGVHIADVEHFVPEGGPVDTEARKRATSVYFPGRVVPMLPTTLSNGVCCLRPGEPRFTKSVFITYDRDGRVIETDFAHTVIRSDARLTYEEASAIIDGHERGPRGVTTLLKNAARLARRIHKRRRDEGMIVLSLPETEIQVDGRGHVTGAVQADTSFSHTIIEMFMVEANEAVSRRLTKLEVPHIRRIHPPPAKDDTGSLACLGPLLGQPPPTELDRKSIADLLDTARGLPAETAVNFMLLRALSQACYSTATDEHFALASEHYCHFTSPIRRYPDLAVHRLFDRCVTGDTDNLQVVDAYQEELARQCSSAERRAIQAERDAQRVLLALLMRNHIGETFDGFVTNVTTFGAYVQMRPILAEGLIRVDDFEHDHWRFDRRRGELIGARSNRHVFVGLPVRVRVAAVDILRQEVSLLPVGDKPIGIMMPREAPRKPRSTPNRRPPQRSSGRSPERSPRRRRTRR